jgi:hypothetical protein
VDKHKEYAVYFDLMHAGSETWPNPMPQEFCFNRDASGMDMMVIQREIEIAATREEKIRWQSWLAASRRIRSWHKL